MWICRPSAARTVARPWDEIRIRDGRSRSRDLTTYVSTGLITSSGTVRTRICGRAPRLASIAVLTHITESVPRCTFSFFLNRSLIIVTYKKLLHIYLLLTAPNVMLIKINKIAAKCTKNSKQIRKPTTICTSATRSAAVVILKLRPLS